MKKYLFAALVFLLLCAPAVLSFAANPDDVLGVWLTEDKEAKVDIFKCADAYCGKIVWLKEPNYPAGSKEGTPGIPKIDFKNPDPALRNRPILGMQFMSDFKHSDDNVYKDGHIYDPEKGKTYSGKLTLVSPHELDLRGYIGISLIGRTSKWTR